MWQVGETAEVMRCLGIAVLTLVGWQVPACFAQLRRLLDARLRKHGSRDFVQIATAGELSIEEVTRTVEQALQLSVISNSLRRFEHFDGR